MELYLYGTRLSHIFEIPRILNEKPNISNEKPSISVEIPSILIENFEILDFTYLEFEIIGRNFERNT